MKACRVLLPRFAVAPALPLLACLLPLPSAFPAPGGTGSPELETSVRRVIEERCGRCHDGALATSKPAALRVFDLRIEDWTRSMSDEQLKRVTGRTNGLDLTQEQHAEIARFIEAKLSQRLTGAPCHSASRSKPGGRAPAR